MIKTEIITLNAPKAVGPYSQGVKANGFIFLAGQIGINPITGDLVDGGIEEQTDQVIKNLEGVLKEAGLDLSNIVRTDIFITNMGNYAKLNETYGKFFSEGVKPSRLTVQVSALPKGALVEISAIAAA